MSKPPRSTNLVKKGALKLADMEAKSKMQVIYLVPKYEQGQAVNIINGKHFIFQGASKLPKQMVSQNIKIKRRRLFNPTLWRYVSEFFGKSKLITTLTA